MLNVVREWAPCAAECDQQAMAEELEEQGCEPLDVCYMLSCGLWQLGSPKRASEFADYGFDVTLTPTNSLWLFTAQKQEARGGQNCLPLAPVRGDRSIVTLG